MPNEEAEKKGHDAGDHSHCSHAHEHDEHGHCGHDHAAHAHDAHGHSHDSHAHGHDDHGHGGHGGFVPPNSIHDHTLVAVCLVTLAGLIWLIGYWSTCSFTAHATAAEHQSAPGADEGQTPGPGHEEQTSGTTGEGAEHH